MKIENCARIVPITFGILIFNILFAIFNSCSAQLTDSIPRGVVDPADSSEKIIGDIIIIGNKLTKEFIITRELTFKKGDTIPFEDFEKKRIRSEQNIYNTSLFNSAHITWLKTPDGFTSIYIILKERWYIFPVPIFEIIERNFNVWWETKDFSRVVYGAAVTWFNFRGRNETLNMELRLGYVQKINLGYTIPYINKNQRSGLNFRFSSSRNHQTNYATLFNVPVYYKDETDFSIKLTTASVEYTNRQGFYMTHYVSASYIDAQTQDTVRNLNPDFFVIGKATQRYVTVRYLFKSEHRDYIYYPLKGYEYDVELVKDGLPILNDDLNTAYVTFNARKYWQLSRKWFFASGLRGKLSNSNFQPYFNTRAIGYGRDYLRGYEYYVTDGQSYGLLKTNLKFELLHKREVHAGFIPLEKFSTIPFAFYLNIYGDGAYVRDKQFYQTNSLTNSWLYGYGAGIDLVTYYDVVLRFEYSFNKFGESGFFLHFSAPI